MLELTCSCCGNHVSLKARTVKETVDIIKSGWGSYGSALYCPECTRTWNDRNSKDMADEKNTFICIMNCIQRQKRRKNE